MDDIETLNGYQQALLEIAENNGNEKSVDWRVIVARKALGWITDDIRGGAGG